VTAAPMDPVKMRRVTSCVCGGGASKNRSCSRLQASGPLSASPHSPGSLRILAHRLDQGIARTLSWWTGACRCCSWWRSNLLLSSDSRSAIPRIISSSGGGSCPYKDSSLYSPDLVHLCWFPPSFHGALAESPRFISGAAIKPPSDELPMNLGPHLFTKYIEGWSFRKFASTFLRTPACIGAKAAVAVGVGKEYAFAWLVSDAVK
jgi:hypothetical protein